MKIIIIKNPYPLKTELPHLLSRRDPILNRPHYLTVDNFDFIKAAQDGYHIITVAFIGLTYFSSICEYGFGIKQSEQEKLIQPILNKKETGTLYPKHNLTILPYRYTTNAFITSNSHDITNCKSFSVEEIKTQIEDSLRAEIKYIKKGKLFFDFQDLQKDMFRYFNVLIGFLCNEYKKFNWECYVYSVDNSEFKI
jgi:hypothetical protein